MCCRCHNLFCCCMPLLQIAQGDADRFGDAEDGNGVEEDGEEDH